MLETLQSHALVVASLVSLVALVLFVRALQGPRARRLLGPAADWRESLRRGLLPLVDRVARARLSRDHYAYLPNGCFSWRFIVIMDLQQNHRDPIGTNQATRSSIATDHVRSAVGSGKTSK